MSGVLRGNFPRTPGHEIERARRQQDCLLASPRRRTLLSSALLEVARHILAPVQHTTMSHERSTPSPGPEDFASSPSSTIRFSASPSTSTRENVPLTALERFAMSKPDSSLRALAGATGGFASGVVACPLDVIKTKLQAQGGFRTAAAMKRTNIPSRDPPHLYKGMIGTASTIWKEEGLRGMYRGLGPIILGYIPTWAVYFSVYGKSKDFLAERHGMFTISQLRDIDKTDSPHSQHKYCKLLVIYYSWSLWNYGYQSNLGDQNTAYVTS